MASCHCSALIRVAEGREGSTGLTRLYAELSSLFLRFYVRREDLNSPLSAAAVHALLQTIVLVIAIMQMQWVGITCTDTNRDWFVTIGAGLGLFAANAIYLMSSQRRRRLLSHVEDPHCPLGRAFLGAVGSALIVTMFMIQGWVPWLPSSLELWAVCVPS